MCTHGDVLSRPVLMLRGLDGIIAACGVCRRCDTQVAIQTPAQRAEGRVVGQLCGFEGPAEGRSRDVSVALARGKHLFPFRTEQLSPIALMVLGLHGPGRVGRRRFLQHSEPLRKGRLESFKGGVRARRASPRARPPRAARGSNVALTDLLVGQRDVRGSFRRA